MVAKGFALCNSTETKDFAFMHACVHACVCHHNWIPSGISRFNAWLSPVAVFAEQEVYPGPGGSSLLSWVINGYLTITGKKAYYISHNYHLHP